jgi:hypothetical protein
VGPVYTYHTSYSATFYVHVKPFLSLKTTVSVQILGDMYLSGITAYPKLVIVFTVVIVKSEFNVVSGANTYLPALRYDIALFRLMCM